MCASTIAIILASVGAAAQLIGVILVVREISGDRRQGNSLIDKQRQWKPQKRGPARRVHASQLEQRSSFAPYRVEPRNDPTAAQIASLATAFNRLTNEMGDALDQRTAQLLEAIDEGDKELRDVQKRQLTGNAFERIGGVVCIIAGILLSLASTIVATAT